MSGHRRYGTAGGAKMCGKRDETEAFQRLTNKQKAFVVAYLSNGFNATQAAIKAGYNPRSAQQVASVTLRKPNVAAVMRRELAKHGITPEAVKIALAEIAFGADLADFEEFLDGTMTLRQLRGLGVNTKLVKSAREVRTANGEKKRHLALYDRVWALKELARVMGIVSETRRIEGHLKVEQSPDLSRLPPKLRKQVCEAFGGPKE